MVCAIGGILNNTQEEKNAWNLRMMKAQFGDQLNVPKDWDTLSEEEKQRRLDGALNAL
jgi:hypothetical protein